jgi:hypothetical protein
MRFCTEKGLKCVQLRVVPTDKPTRRAIKWRLPHMPPTDRTPPPCPNCRSSNTERLPFEQKGMALPVYSCMDCGHVWREPLPPPKSSRRAGKKH